MGDGEASASDSGSPFPGASIAEWRQLLLRRLVGFAAVVSGIATVALAPRQFNLGRPALTAALAIATVVLALMAVLERPTAQLRGLVLSVCLLGLATTGIVVTHSWLPNSFVAMMLVTLVLAVTVGARAAWLALAASLLIITALGAWLITGGPFPPDAGSDVSSAYNWVRITSIFAGVSGSALFAVTRLIRRLEQALARNHVLLERERQAAAERVKRLEAEQQRLLVQQESQRLEALGRLSGGIAHDFNNLLTVVVSNAELLLSRGGDAQLLGEVRDAGLRGAELSRTLLTFGRISSTGVSAVPLNATVDDALKLLRRLLLAGQSLEFHPDPRVERVRSNVGELNQVVMNLVLNARDALHDSSGDRVVRLATSLEADGRVALTVADRGVGMDAATQQRAFEPYFSTKPLGRGTGLGLSTVHGIVTSHGGEVSLTSTPGAGTTVKVLLNPAEADAEPARAPEPASDAAKVELARRLVLTIDDEPLALKVLERLLRAEGYEVARGAQVPFLFCTGYSEDALPDAFLAQPGRALLQKPFTRDDLMARVDELLRARP
ncbi:MAG: ATP-binding protein [Myxococcaceae bacterium]